MPTPVLVTTFEDNFTRANENPLSDGGQWTKATGPASNALQISANTCKNVTSTGTGAAFVSGTSFVNDQFAQATGKAWSAASSGVLFLGVRTTNPGTIKQLNGYVGFVTGKSGAAATALAIARDDAGGQTILNSLSSGFPTIAATDVWALAVVGSTLYFMQNGSVLITATDSVFTSGSPAVLILTAASTANLTLGDFQAGSASVPGSGGSGNQPLGNVIFDLDSDGFPIAELQTGTNA